MTRVKGFEPFFTAQSKLLILGSFPSVKSRAQNFYYGNPQNAFWRILSNFFKESEPKTVEDKKSFLDLHNIALWDIVTECEIVGSQDATIKDYRVADLNLLLKNCNLRLIILNGGTAEKIFLKKYAEIEVPFIKLPSTSPANARRKDEEWYNALSRIFSGN